MYDYDNYHFCWPEGNLAVDASGRVYAPDNGYNRVQIYKPDGSFVVSIGNGG